MPYDANAAANMTLVKVQRWGQPQAFLLQALFGFKLYT